MVSASPNLNITPVDHLPDRHIAAEEADAAESADFGS